MFGPSRFPHPGRTDPVMERAVVAALEAAAEVVNERDPHGWLRRCKKSFVVLTSPPSPMTLASTIPMPRLKHLI